MCMMSPDYQSTLNRVKGLSREEQLALISTIAKSLSEVDTRSLPLHASDTINAIKNNPSIVRGDKSIDPTPLFGIWADKGITLEKIREKAWKRS